MTPTTLLVLLDDDLADCPVCGTAHDAELHGAVQRLRSWLKADINRRLELARTFKQQPKSLPKYSPGPVEFKNISELVIAGRRGARASARVRRAARMVKNQPAVNARVPGQADSTQPQRRKSRGRVFRQTSSAV